MPAPSLPAPRTPLTSRDLETLERRLLRGVEENENDASAWYQLGLLAMRQKRHELAVERLERAVELEPAQAHLHHHLANCLQTMGKRDEAAAHLDRVAQLKPDCPESHNNVGVAYARCGKADRALAAFANAVRQRPDFAEAQNNWGNVLAEQGQLEAAIEHFRQAIALNPDYADAQHNLALALLRHGQAGAAVPLLEKALKLNPKYLSARLQLANAHFQLGKLTEAETGFRRVLQRKTDHVEARQKLSLVLARQGKLDEAVAGFYQCLVYQPESPDTYNNLGIALVQLDRRDEGIAAFRQALRYRPDFAEAMNNLGNALLPQQKLDEALRCFQDAAAAKAEYLQPQLGIAGVFEEQGKLDEAAAIIQEVLRGQPDHPDACCRLGRILRKQGRTAEAFPYYRRAADAQPGNPTVRLPLAVALAEEGHFDEAITLYEEIIRAKPELADAHSCLGIARMHQGLLEQAVACFDDALRHRPGDPEIHVNRALTYLALGDFDRGWTEFEWRWKSKKIVPRPVAQPAWDGTPLPNGTILIHAEQGLGDTLQFIRFVALVKERVGKVLLECQAPLRHLLAACAGVDEVVDGDLDLVTADVQAPLMSLPRILGLRPEQFVCSVPLILVEPGQRERWSQNLSSLSGLKVGIVWQGNPRFAGDRYRSVRLATFAPLTELAGVHLCSLQKGEAARQLNETTLPGKVTDLAAHFGPEFRDVAAAVANLDLVITVDTAIAHLAGALGVPLWILIPFNADWRWGREGETTPWYPTARLFRQRRWGDWPEVIERVTAELQRLAEQPRAVRVRVEVTGTEVLERIVLAELATARGEPWLSPAALSELQRQQPRSEEIAEMLAQLKSAHADLARLEVEMARVANRKANSRAHELVREFVAARQQRADALASIAGVLQESPVARVPSSGLDG